MQVPKPLVPIVCVAVLILFLAGGVLALSSRTDAPTILEERLPETQIPPSEETGTEEGMMTRSIFFSKEESTETDCAVVHAVSRTTPWVPAVAQTAIRLLLEGPTSAEQEAGYHTSIPEGTALQSIVLTDGVLAVDFNDALNRGGGSCRVVAARSQIMKTLLQFTTVREVVISVNGEVREALQP